MRENEFIKNVLDIEVNGFTGETRFIVSAMFNKFYEDELGEYADIEFKVLEDVTFTRKELKDEGGHCEVVRQLKKEYHIVD